jgi:hypothetical protein
MKVRAWMWSFVVALATVFAAASALAQGVEGRWELIDQPGYVVEFAGGHYTMTANGTVQDEGGYAVDGDRLTLNSTAEGGATQATFTRAGDELAIETPDGERMRFRPSAAAAAGGQVAQTEPPASAEPVPAEQAPPATTAPQEPVATSETPPAAEPANLPGGGVIDGRWTVRPGIEVEFSNGQYKVLENGNQTEAGEYRLEADTLIRRALPDGTEQRARFTRVGDLLLIEPDDAAPMLLRATPGSGVATPFSPAEIEGRWRTSNNQILEVGGGRYTMSDPGGPVLEQGTYRVEGDVVIAREEKTGTETRLQWVRLGDRLAIQPGDGVTIVLTPETAVATLQVPQTAPVVEGPPVVAPTPAQEPVPPAAASEPTPPPVTQNTETAPVQPQLQPVPEVSPPQPEIAQQPEAPQQPDVGGQPQPVAPQPPVQPQPQPTMPQPMQPLTDGTPLAQQWLGYLQGKRLVQAGQPQMQNATQQMLDLCSDGQYFWYVGAAGQMPQPQGSGYWSIVTQGQTAGLRVQTAAGTGGVYRLDFDGQTAYLNGLATMVVAQNQSCR